MSVRQFVFSISRCFVPICHTDCTYLIITLARTKKFLPKALLMFVRIITILQLQEKSHVLMVSFILERIKQAAYFVNIFFLQYRL